MTALAPPVPLPTAEEAFRARFPDAPDTQDALVAIDADGELYLRNVETNYLEPVGLSEIGKAELKAAIIRYFAQRPS